MTDETKQLFDAPWKVSLHFIVKDNRNRVVVSGGNEEDNNRIARLPELYDALMEAAAGKCWSCAGESSETMLDEPGPKGHEDCYVAEWRQLLKKVRDAQ